MHFPNHEISGNHTLVVKIDFINIGVAVKMATIFILNICVPIDILTLIV